MPLKLLIINIAANLFLLTTASAQTRVWAREIDVPQRPIEVGRSEQHTSKPTPTATVGSTAPGSQMAIGGEIGS